MTTGVVPGVKAGVTAEVGFPVKARVTAERDCGTVAKVRVMAWENSDKHSTL